MCRSVGRGENARDHLVSHLVKRINGIAYLIYNFSQRTARTRTPRNGGRQRAEGRGEGGARSRGDRETSSGVTSRTCSTANTPATNPTIIHDRRTVVTCLRCAAGNATCHWSNATRPTWRSGPFESAIFAAMLQDRTLIVAMSNSSFYPS